MPDFIVTIEDDDSRPEKDLAKKIESVLRSYEEFGNYDIEVEEYDDSIDKYNSGIDRYNWKVDNYNFWGSFKNFFRWM